MKHESIREVVYNTAKGLHKAGVFSTQTMREFDALCLKPVKKLAPRKIKAIRVKNRASQAVFAAYLNTSVSAVQKWENGQKKPSGPALKLLNMVEQKGLKRLG